MRTIKAVVVDDTIVYRKIVGDVLKEIPGVEVVGTANNGKIALSKIKTLKPDMITLDIEMPEVNGIEVLQELRKMDRPPIAVVLSTLTQEGSEMTIRALELGAFDFVPKPEAGKMTDNVSRVKTAIEPIINVIKRRKGGMTAFGKAGKTTGLRPSRPAPPKPLKPRVKIPKAPLIRSKSEIIGIGISTGGPNALTRMIPMLPENLKAPVLIVQHMPPMFTASLANSLNNKSKLEVKEAAEGDVIEPGRVYIAPGGKQMKIVAGADGLTRKVKITNDPPENSCRPSVDYLFRSIAQHYVGRSTGVIMTGMGSDGTKGLAQMKKNGSTVIAQDEESCTVFGMPKEPIETGLADIIAPLDRIAEEIIKTVAP